MELGSKYEKLEKKKLVFISQRLIEDEFNYDDPYENIDKSHKILFSILNYFGFNSPDNIDIEFFAKLIQENEEIIDSEDGLKKSNNIIIPKSSKYKFFYSLDARISQTENYYSTWESYESEWVKESVYSELYTGDWDYYNGTLIGEDVYDSDSSDFEFTGLELISENNKKSNMVLENAEKALNQLDRTTLIRLRNIIDNKLKN